MLEPRKLIPFSIEYCRAPIAVITEMTEKTPIVIPVIVRLERSLFAPSEVSAILIISPNNILFITKRSHRIQARCRPGRSESRNQTGRHGHEHARDDEAHRKSDWKGRERRGN